MGGACGTHWRKGKYIQGFSCKREGNRLLEDLGVGGRITLIRT
jgi:hypothetical protein